MCYYLILVPVYNEEKNILNFFYNLISFIDFKTDNVLIIDDNSNDGTRVFLNNILKKLEKLGLENNIKIIFNEKNLGYGSNVLKGMEYAINLNVDFLITIDADFQHLTSYINIFKSLSLKYDFITGSRYSKQSIKLSEYNFYRSLINKKLLEFLRFYFPEFNITDFFCGFRLYSLNLIRKIFNKLKEKEKIYNGFSYEFPIFLWLELLKNKDLKLKEIPIPYITFLDRDFKGSKSLVLRNHYIRIKKYIRIFLRELGERGEEFVKRMEN